MLPHFPQPPQADDVHLSDYLHVILYRRKIFLLAFLTVFIGVALYTFTVKPVFEAFTTLQLQSPQGGRGDLLAELGGTAQNPVDTEIEIIKSRTMAENVILRMQPADAPPLSPEALQSAAIGLKRGVVVTEVGKKTGILRLSYQSTDPRHARDVVNTLAQVYQEHNVDYKTQEASKTLDFIAKQLRNTQNDLDSAEKNLQAFKSQSGAISLDAGNVELVRRLAEIDGQLSALRLQKKGVEYTAAALRQAIRKGEVHTVPAGLQNDSGSAPLASRLSELDVQHQALLQELSEGHPQVKALKVQIDEVQNKLLATYESTLNGVSRQERALEAELKAYEEEFRHLPEAERELGKLLRVTKVNADIYTFLLQKHEEARITKAATISNISVVDPAIIPATPVKPQKQKNLLLGLLLGLMLGTGLAFFVDYLDNCIKGGDEAQRVIGAPVLAVIPFIAADNAAKPEEQFAMTTHLRPKSVVAEAFRSLRTNLHFSALNREKQVLLITSTFPGEGKSTVSTNLAITLSQTGARVLVIDGDLRRPSLHTKFGHSKVPGLSELLAGDLPVASVLHDTGIANLSLISAGTTPPQPAELLGSERMAGLLTALRGQFDHIVIDAPPVLAVTDAPLLTSRSDLVLVVLESDRVPVKAAQRMVAMLGHVQAPVAGIVVNDKSNTSIERYGYYGHGYANYDDDAAGGEVQAGLSATAKLKRWGQRLFRG